MLTDTIYGIITSINNKEEVKKIFSLKKRNPNKALIVLISSFDDITSMGISLNKDVLGICKKYWPGATSIILPCSTDLDLAHIHRGNNGIAFRFVDDLILVKIIRETGPLVAPSANIEGYAPAENIDEAYSYFGAGVDLYYERVRNSKGKSSRLLRIENNNSVTVLRD